jgi:hypothetical protein
VPPPVKPPVKRRIWRITEGAPGGTYAVGGAAPPAAPEPAREKHPGWAVSSFELKYGLDVCEAQDTVPAELFDELFKAPPSKGSGS